MDYLRNENARLQDSKKPSPSEMMKVIKMLWDNPFIKFCAPHHSVTRRNAQAPIGHLVGACRFRTRFPDSVLMRECC